MSDITGPNEAFLPEEWENLTIEQQVIGATGPDAEKVAEIPANQDAIREERL